MTSPAPTEAPIPTPATAPEAAPVAAPPRVVMFVYNDATNDSRVLREARTLAAAGWAVTLVARTRPADPERVFADRIGDLDVVRVPLPTAWRRRWRALRTPWRQWPEDVRVIVRDLRRGPGGFAAAFALVLLRIVTLPVTALLLPLSLPRFVRPDSPNIDLVDWLLRWRFGILGWCHAAADAAPAADVYHGHDMTALPAAVRAAGRHGARLVYDSHEIFMESGRNALRPRWARALFTRIERGWARRADALVTVNDALVGELRRRLRYAGPILSLHNTPGRWTPPAVRPDRIREATGIPADARIALYHGQFFAHRGLDELALAILEPGMERVHAAFLGFGPDEPRLRAMAAEPRFGGRLHVLKGVPPDALLPWVASADVGVSAVAPSTLNHRLSTPNKLFECLAAGVPVVISDLPGMRGVLLADPDRPLGAVARSLAPADVARAIREVLDLPPDELEALRARCLAAAHARWNWETESAGLVARYRDLVPHSPR